MEKNCD